VSSGFVTFADAETKTTRLARTMSMSAKRGVEVELWRYLLRRRAPGGAARDNVVLVQYADVGSRWTSSGWRQDATCDCDTEIKRAELRNLTCTAGRTIRPMPCATSKGWILHAMQSVSDSCKHHAVFCCPSRMEITLQHPTPTARVMVRSSNP